MISNLEKPVKMPLVSCLGCARWSLVLYFRPKFASHQIKSRQNRRTFVSQDPTTESTSVVAIASGRLSSTCGEVRRELGRCVKGGAVPTPVGEQLLAGGDGQLRGARQVRHGVQRAATQCGLPARQPPARATRAARRAVPAALGRMPKHPGRD